MKRLILKTITFIIAFFIIFSFITWLTQPAIFNREYALWKTKKDFIKKNNKTTRHNIIIGDSQAFAAFIPSELGGNYFNLSLSGATPIEGYYTLLKCFRNITNVDTLIISYNPFHLKFSDTFWDRAMKFDYLNMQECLEVFTYAQEHSDLFWNLDSAEFIEGSKARIVLQKLYFPYYYRTELENFSLERIITNLKVYKATNLTKGQNYFGRASYCNLLPYKIPVFEHFQPSEVINHYFEELLKLALDMKLEVYYINVPVNQITFDSQKPAYINDYNSYFLNLQKKYPKVHFQHSIEPVDSSFFGDPTHLNKKGATAFSKEVGKTLKRNMIVLN